jgi:hypothetical protein
MNQRPQPSYVTLSNLFADRLFVVPEYQRLYSWEKQQLDELFSDLRDLSNKAEDEDHYMGGIVLHTLKTCEIGGKEYRRCDVVDGQQRLTTLIILLKCIQLELADLLPDLLKRRDDPQYLKSIKLTKKELENIKVSEEQLTETLIKPMGHPLLLQRNNLTRHIFNRFIRKGKEPKKNDLKTQADRNLASAIRECKAFLKQWQKGFSNPAQSLIKLLLLINNRLGFVVFETVDKRTVHTIFESLNSRGRPVDPLDKTKTVIMRAVYQSGEEEQVITDWIQSLQDLWAQIYQEMGKKGLPGEQILRVAATLNFGSEKKKPLSTAKALKRINEQISKNPSSGLDFSDLLLRCAVKLNEVYRAPERGKLSEILQARLLAVAIELATDLEDDQRKKLIDQLERVTFRIYGLSGKDARYQVGNYVGLAVNIHRQELRTYEEIMKKLHELGKDYPIDKAVENGLANKRQEDPEMCRYVLWEYEIDLARKLSGGVPDEDVRRQIFHSTAEQSIEHIFPRNVNAQGWVNKIPQNPSEHVDRIGNLLLLPVSLNKKAGDEPFAKKKEVYGKSNVRMAREEVCKENDWGLEQIEQREQRIMEFAKRRWADLAP